MNRFQQDSFIYDWISCVVPDRVYFGPIPNVYMLEQLKKENFTFIINLTENSYHLIDDFDIPIIHFPIIDNSIPDDIADYCKFIIRLKQLYENLSNKIYIHCKAGHSRSSMVTVSLLFCVYNQELKEIINIVTDCHRNRPIIRDIWKFKSPFNYRQFMFLCMIHKNVYINSNSDSKIYNWLSPKNIWINHMNTLDDYVQYSIKNNTSVNIFDLIKHNTYLLNRIKNTYLKKLTFIFNDKTLSEFYDNTFKTIREKLTFPFPKIIEKSQSKIVFCEKSKVSD